MRQKALDDATLLKRIAAGDDAAFSAFYRAHLNAVIAFFSRYGHSLDQSGDRIAGARVSRPRVLA